MAIYHFKSRVAYDDIDNDLHLTLKGAMRLMQEAALLDADKAGYSVKNVPDTGLVWLLVEWRIRMEAPCTWNDDIEVQTWARSMERLKSIRDFLIYGPDGRLCATGESVWVLVSAKTGHPTRITEEVKSSYDLEDKTVFDTPLAPLPQGVGEVVGSYQVRHRDLDTNHHMNNRIYPAVAREALPTELQNRQFREITVHYHRQLLLGDEALCRYRRGENCHIVELTGEDPKHIHATVVFYE